MPDMARTGMQLLEMGKTAARKYIDGKIPLDDSVKALKELHKLSNEEVRRVCEKANHAVFLSRYHGGDTLGQFQVADADRILGVTAEKEVPMAKAASLGPFRTDGYNAARDESNVIQVDFEKRAAAACAKASKATPGRSGPTRTDLAQVVSEVGDKKIVAEHRFRKAKMRFKAAALEALRSNTLCEVLESLVPRTTEDTAELLLELDEPVARVKAASYFKLGEPRVDAPEPNPEHELVQAYDDLVKAHEDLGVLKQAHELAKIDLRKATEDVGYAGA